MKASKKASKRRRSETKRSSSKKTKVSHDGSEISDRLDNTFLLGVGPDFTVRPDLQGPYTLFQIKWMMCKLRTRKVELLLANPQILSGSEIVGFDFQAVTNENPTACTLLASHVDTLTRHGLPLVPEAKDAGTDANEDHFELTVSSYVDIWLLIAKLGNEDLEWEVIDPWFKDFDLLAVGGRSLFKLGATPFRSKFRK